MAGALQLPELIPVGEYNIDEVRLCFLAFSDASDGSQCSKRLHVFVRELGLSFSLA